MSAQKPSIPGRENSDHSCVENASAKVVGELGKSRGSGATSVMMMFAANNAATTMKLVAKPRRSARTSAPAPETIIATR